MKTISRELLADMTRRLVVEFDPEQVILFGSQAWGIPNSDSDIDLMVIVSGSDQSAHQRMVRARGCLSSLDAPIDVLVKTRREFDRYKHVYASLECLIAEQGMVLYDGRRQKRTRAELAHAGTT